MAKQTILKERGTGEDMYPLTFASLVRTANGGNVDGELEKAKFKLFDDGWMAAGGTVIVSGETYGLNGIDNLTYGEAMTHLSLFPAFRANAYKAAAFSNNHSIRTTFLVYLNPWEFPDISRIFHLCENLESVRFADTSGLADISHAFMSCKNLKKIFGVLGLAAKCNATQAFLGCNKLEEVQLSSIATNIDLRASSMFSIGSLRFMVEHAANTSQITITLHPDAYARVTDGLFAIAAEKQIAITTI